MPSGTRMRYPRVHFMRGIKVNHGTAELTLESVSCSKKFKKTLKSADARGKLVTCPHCRHVGRVNTGGIVLGGDPEGEKKEK